jgi:rsbT co-antagonist protein RsbR
MRKDSKSNPTAEAPAESDAKLLRELVDHFNKLRDSLRKQWVEMMTAKGFLAGLSQEEIQNESITIYDTCVGCLEKGEYTGAEEYAARMAARGVLSNMTPEQILGGMLTLRDVYGRSLFERYQQNLQRLSETLDIYEPVANKILSIVALAFLEEREKVVREQQEAIRELSTPVLQFREGMLLLPIVGVIDSHRAYQLTEQLLRAIRTYRAKVVVMDITGVPAVDSKVANHLLQTVEACRLMGAIVIATGLSPEIAQALVALGVDLGKMRTIGDLLGGIEEAELILGYKVARATERDV